MQSGHPKADSERPNFSLRTSSRQLPCRSNTARSVSRLARKHAPNGVQRTPCCRFHGLEALSHKAARGTNKRVAGGALMGLYTNAHGSTRRRRVANTKPGRAGSARTHSRTAPVHPRSCSRRKSRRKADTLILTATSAPCRPPSCRVRQKTDMLALMARCSFASLRDALRAMHV